MEITRRVFGAWVSCVPFDILGTIKPETITGFTLAEIDSWYSEVTEVSREDRAGNPVIRRQDDSRRPENTSS